MNKFFILRTLCLFPVLISSCRNEKVDFDLTRYLSANFVDSCRQEGVSSEKSVFSDDGQIIWSLRHSSDSVSNVLSSYSRADDADLRMAIEIVRNAYQISLAKSDFLLFRDRVLNEDCYWLIRKDKTKSYFIVFKY